LKVGDSTPPFKQDLELLLEILLREMKKNIFTHKTYITTVGFIVMSVLCSVVVFPLNTYAETAVSNSVSVSSTGDGASHASVKTSVNGVVVENSSVEGSGSITSYIETVNGSTTVHTTSNTLGHDEELIMLMQRLKALLHYYVSLLNAQS
jgi:ABC-type Na+ efflux pump permease subunit